MAICITLMMGRLGSIFGANITGLLLDNYCQLAFVVSGSILIRKLHFFATKQFVYH